MKILLAAACLLVAACVTTPTGAPAASPPPTPSPSPTPAPAPSIPVATPGDAPGADGTPCLTAAACASGVCEGQGCDASSPGKCVPRSRPCTEDYREYCGCDGKIFHGSGSCPGQRYQARGGCPR
jgi:hypothetical protein